jgi:hypothetical protein
MQWMCINPLSPILPTHSIYVFCVDLRKNSINFSGFINEMERVYCAVRTGALNVIQVVRLGAKKCVRNFRHCRINTNSEY